MDSRLALPKKGNGSLLNAMMEAKNKACNQADATGFIRLNALRLKVAAKVQAKKK
jgi:argininosuccinate synthase